MDEQQQSNAEGKENEQEVKKDQCKGKWNKKRWRNRERNQWKGNWRGRRGKGYTFVFK